MSTGWRLDLLAGVAGLLAGVEFPFNGEDGEDGLLVCAACPASAGASRE